VTKVERASEPDAVDAYFKTLKHPLAGLAKDVRKAILGADPSIGEEIKWNAPAFFYTGAMKPFNPKEYRRHLVVFNFFRKDSLRLVFWHGDKASDKSGWLEGSYADGRRLAALASKGDLARNKKTLQSALKAQLKFIRQQ
jgi:hypothetical protein